MKNRQMLRVLLTGLCLAVLCVGLFTHESHAQSDSSQIVIGRIQDSDNLDPVIQHHNANIWVFNLVLEGLVKTSDDGTTIEPALAESWDISEDGLTYTFHLKPGIKFSDGTPVTGEDWIWSLTRARDTEASPWKFAGEGIKDVTAPDDNTLVVTLKEPWAAILADLAMFNMTVQSKAHFEKVGEEGYSRQPIGTGPYYIDEWRKGEYILMKKNPHYHIEGLPKTDEIKFVVISDDNTRVLQLQAGKLDIATYLPFNRMAELDADPNIVAKGIPSTETRYIILNNNVKPLDDIRVRHALQYATDKDAIVALILFGYGEKAISFAPKAGLYYNDALEDYGYDVEKAKALLAEAGYPDGFDVELLVRAGNAVYEQLSVILKEQWSKVGINVNILSLEPATATERYKAMQHEITLAGWTNDINDPSQQVEYTINPDVVQCYYTGWVNEKAVELAEQGKRETDEAKRAEIYKEIQRIHYEETPMIPVFHATYPVAMRTNIKGFVQTPLGNYRFENLVKE